MCVYNKTKERASYSFIVITTDNYWRSKCGIICFEKLCIFLKTTGLPIVIAIHYAASIPNFLY